MKLSTVCLLVLTSSVSAERGVGRLRKQQHLQFHDEEHAYHLQGRTGSSLRNLQGGGSGSGAVKGSKFETEVVDEDDESRGGQGDARTSKYGDTDEDEIDVQLPTTEDELYTGLDKNSDPTQAPYDAPSPFDDLKEMYMSLDTTNHPTFRPTPAPTKSPSVTPSAVPSTHPSAAPSATPSVSPSSAPSGSPSMSPSSGPSSSPSTDPSVMPSNAPSQAPSDFPSRAPSPSPSEAPSAIASGAPSVTPSLSPTVLEAPSTSPSNSPSAQRSAEPSREQTTSAAPSSSPSTAPSSSPSASPTGAPITRAPTPVPETVAPITVAPTTTPPACGIRMTTDDGCQRENGRPCAILRATPLDTLLCKGGVADGNPTEMGWIYRPNLCGASTTVQNVFVCMDSNDGPPAAADNGRVFIEVTGALAGGVVFSGTVLPGELVVMKNPDGSPLNGNVEVKIHEGTDRSGIELQSMALSIRCSGFEDNTIGRKYGSLEFVSYIDGSGAAVSGFEKVSYFNRVINLGDNNLTFKAFGTGDSDESGFTTTDITPVDNQVLVGTETLIRQDYNILLIGRNSVTITGFVQGTTADGGTCRDNGSTDFLVVLPAPAPTPSPTTLAPTPAPITPSPITPLPTSAPITPVPTPIPPLGSCFLSTDARCTNGASPCEDIPALSEDELRCNVGGAPQQLGWFYRAGGCDATTTTQTIGCLDSDGGPPSAAGDGRVFLEVQGVNSNRIYHFTSVLPGQFVVWVDSDNLVIEESIVVDIYEGSNQAGRKLQTLVFNVGCGDIDQDVTLGKSFGALEFGSYSGSNGEFVQGFVDVLYTFSVQNTGREDFELTEFMSSINTQTEDFVPAPPRNMISAEGGSFSSSTLFTVPLTGPLTIDASVVARGLVLENDFICSSTSDTYSFDVV